jgi:type II secretory pathway pseudopilin PulG
VTVTAQKRGVTLVEATLALALFLAATAFVVTRGTGSNTAAADTEAQAHLSVVASAQAVAYEQAGTFVPGSELTTVATTLVGASTASTSPAEVSMNATADAFVLTAVGGDGSCWAVARNMGGSQGAGTASGRFVVHGVDLDAAANCSASAAATATMAGATGTSFNAPATLTLP